jgi:hypothetical protein
MEIAAVEEQGDRTGEFTEWQVRRAAWLTARFLNFKARIER